MKRGFDFIVALIMLIVGLTPMLLVALAVKLTSKGPILNWSDRLGRGNRLFKMPKFRTMRVGTPQVASHLLADPNAWLTPIGGFLRRSSLDELPQLWSILKGDMSFVGPRPALYNQHDLISLRMENGIHTIQPGLTGWAQVNGRDEAPVAVKVSLDKYYLEHQSFFLDMTILLFTAWKVVRREGTAVPLQVRGADSACAMAQSLLRSGSTFFGKGDYDRAVTDYEQATRLDPTLAVAYVSRGLVWAAKGDYDRAIVDFDEAVRRKPDRPAIRSEGVEEWNAEQDGQPLNEDYAKIAMTLPGMTEKEQEAILATIRDLFRQRAASRLPRVPR